MKLLMLKSLILKKGFINYILAFVLLFGTLIFLVNTQTSVNRLVEESKNNVKYRTIIVTFKDEELLEELEQDNMVEKIEKKDELSYNVILKEYNYIYPFLELYTDYLTYSEITPYSSSEIVNGVSKLLIAIISLVSIIIIFLALFNIVDLAISEKKDISLYKLLGYNNKYLLKSILQILILLHTILYIFSIILSLIMIKLSNFILLLKEIEFSISMIDVFVIINLFLLMLAALFFCTCILYIKIKKIAPIILFKET